MGCAFKGPTEDAKRQKFRAMSAAHSTQQIGGNYGQHWSPSPQVYSGSASGPNPNTLYGAQSALAQSFTTATNCTFSGSTSTVEDPPEIPIEDTGIKVGEVIAWRVWKISDGWLYSMTQDDCEWEPGKDIQAHKIGPILGEGIHAFKTRKGACDYRWNGSTTVVGQVALWGQIYEFEHGWHGEFARVHSLDLTVEHETPEHVEWMYSQLDPRSWWRPWARKLAVGPQPLTLLEQLRQTYGLTEASGQCTTS